MLPLYDIYCPTLRRYYFISCASILVRALFRDVEGFLPVNNNFAQIAVARSTRLSPTLFSILIKRNYSRTRNLSRNIIYCDVRLEIQQVSNSDTRKHNKRGNDIKIQLKIYRDIVFFPCCSLRALTHLNYIHRIYLKHSNTKRKTNTNLLDILYQDFHGIRIS